MQSPVQCSTWTNSPWQVAHHSQRNTLSYHSCHLVRISTPRSWAYVRLCCLLQRQLTYNVDTNALYKFKLNYLTTSLTVALTCITRCSVKHRKRQISTHYGPDTPYRTLTKPGMVRRVRSRSPLDNFGGYSATWVVWQIRNLSDLRAPML